MMTLVWKHAPCRENTLIVLLALADWSNDEGVCWPSIQKLADKSRVDRRSAQRIVRRLKQDHLITIEEGGGRAKQHRYQIETAALCRPLETETAAESRPLPKQNSGVAYQETAALETERATFPTQTATPVSPDPLEEPLVDPSVEPSVPFLGKAFTLALSAFETHRKEIRKPLKPTGRKALYAQLATMSETQAADNLWRSIERGWTGVFPSRESTAQANGGPKIIEDFGDWYTVMGADGTPSKRWRTDEAFAAYRGITVEEVRNGIKR